MTIRYEMDTRRSCGKSHFMMKVAIAAVMAGKTVLIARLDPRDNITLIPNPKELEAPDDVLRRALPNPEV